MSDGSYPTTPGFLEGQIAAVGAIAGVHLIIDGPGCNSQKTLRVAEAHDLYSTLQPSSAPPRVHYSNLLDVDFVFGTEGAVERTMASLVDRHEPALVLLTQHSIPIMVGTDAEALAEGLTERHGVPVLVLSSDPMDGDFDGGYASVMETLARALPLAEPAGEVRGLALIGYLFSRREMDHRSDVQELTTLAVALDLPLRSCWLCGEGLEALEQAAQAEIIIGLPHGGDTAPLLAERLSIPWLPTALPLGAGGTARWLRQVAALVGRQDQVEAYIRRESAALFERLEFVIPQHFAGRQVAVVADPPLALGLVDYLLELGFLISYVGLHTRSASEADAITTRLLAAGQSPEVVIDPKRPDLQDSFARLRDQDRLDLVCASSNERDCCASLGIPQLELGYPSLLRHALFDAPLLGYRGAAWLADALYNRLSEADFLR